MDLLWSLCHQATTGRAAQGWAVGTAHAGQGGAVSEGPPGPLPSAPVLCTLRVSPSQQPPEGTSRVCCPLCCDATSPSRVSTLAVPVLLQKCTGLQSWKSPFSLSLGHPRCRPSANHHPPGSRALSPDWWVHMKLQSNCGMFRRSPWETPDDRTAIMTTGN